MPFSSQASWPPGPWKSSRDLDGEGGGPMRTRVSIESWGIISGVWVLWAPGTGTQTSESLGPWAGVWAGVKEGPGNRKVEGLQLLRDCHCVLGFAVRQAGSPGRGGHSPGSPPLASCASSAHQYRQLAEPEPVGVIQLNST